MTSAPAAAGEQGGLGSKEDHLTVTLLTGGFDKHYAHGIALSLARHGVRLQVIGSDEVDCQEMHSSDGIEFLNWQQGWRRDANVVRKVARLLRFYLRLAVYAARTRSSIFHILWNNKLAYCDRTVLMLYFRLLGKSVVLTAHNVNTAKRDCRDSWLNRFTLKVQYRLANCIFVHTNKMLMDLRTDFGVGSEVVCIIPFGLNDAVVHTSISPAEAKRELGVQESEHVLLFFGRIQPYKGLEYLVEAVELLACQGARYRLIVAGEPKKEYEQYWLAIQRRIEGGPAHESVMQVISYIADDRAEIYFKAADVLVLPYTDIYQSGVLFLGFSFGLPVIATDVGSFREDVTDGETGLICRPADALDLAEAIKHYFASSMYTSLSATRAKVRASSSRRNSWDTVAEITVGAYDQLRRSKSHQEERG